MSEQDQNISEETKQILQDMEEAGEGTHEEIDSEDESKKENKKDPEEELEDAPEEESDEEDDDEEEDEEEDEDEEEKKSSKKPHMPLSKFNKKKEKWEEREKELSNTLTEKEQKILDLEEELRKKNAPEAIEKFAEDNNMSSEAVMSLVDIIKGQIGPTDKLTKNIEDVQKQLQEDREKAAFNNFFDENISPTIKKENSNISQEKLREAREKLRELSYTKKYKDYEIQDIFALKKDEFSEIIGEVKKKKSAEGSKPGSQRGENTKTNNYKDLTKEELEGLLANDKDLSDDEFDKISSELSSRGTSLSVTDEHGNEVK